MNRSESDCVHDLTRAHALLEAWMRVPGQLTGEQLSTIHDAINAIRRAKAAAYGMRPIPPPWWLEVNL